MIARAYDRWAEAIEPDECQPIRIGQPHAPRCPPAQNVQLMAENKILSLEPTNKSAAMYIAMVSKMPDSAAGGTGEFLGGGAGSPKPR